MYGKNGKMAPVKATLTIEPLPKEDRDALAKEREHLIRFVGEGAKAFEVWFAKPWTSKLRASRIP